MIFISNWLQLELQNVGINWKSFNDFLHFNRWDRHNRSVDEKFDAFWWKLFEILQTFTEKFIHITTFSTKKKSGRKTQTLKNLIFP
jgi:hypothetical protein